MFNEIECFPSSESLMRTNWKLQLEDLALIKEQFCAGYNHNIVLKDVPAKARFIRRISHGAKL